MSAALLEKPSDTPLSSVALTHPPSPRAAASGTDAAGSPMSLHTPRARVPAPPQAGGSKGRTARFIAPELRAMAQVVHDVDGRQFPELYAGAGRPAPPARELERVTTEIRDDVPLTAAEFRLFRAAYAECRQHLGGVSAAVMASGSLYSESLTLTTRVEALCADCRVALPRLFPNLKDVHELVLVLSDRGDKRSEVHSELLDRLLRGLCELLTRAIAAVERFRDVRLERQRAAATARRRAAAAAAAATSGSRLAPPSAATPAHASRVVPLSSPPPPPATPEAFALSDSAQADPMLHPALPPLCATTIPSVSAAATATAASHESPAGSPRSLPEVSTLLSLIMASDNNRSRRSPAAHGTDEAPSPRAVHTHAPGAGLNSPLEPPAEEEDSEAHLAIHPGDVGDVDMNELDTDESDFDDLDALADEVAGLGATPAGSLTPARTSEAADGSPRRQRRALRAGAVLESYRLYQTRFLLCEDPSFLGATAPEPLARTSVHAGELALVNTARTPSAVTTTTTATAYPGAESTAAKAKGSVTGASGLLESADGRAAPAPISMAVFMARCTAERAAACRARYDSSSAHGVSRSVAYAALLATMPLDLAQELCALNALLRLHYAHLQWCAEAFRQEEAMRFHVGECLGDLSMQKRWAAALGEGCAACAEEVFSQSGGVLEAFPPSAWRAVGCIVNYQERGVVSPFSLLRVLRVWGPLLLLDRNIASDLQSGTLELAETYESLWPVFARRTDALAGDYVVCLTEEPGEARLLVLRAARARRTSRTMELAAEPAGGRSRLQSWAAQSMPFDLALSTRRFTSQRWLQHRGTLASLGSTLTGAASMPPGASAARASTAALGVVPPLRHFSVSGESAVLSMEHDLVTTSYRLTQETGAWRVEGLSRESFETISDACAAFPTILRRAMGHVYADDTTAAGTDGGGGGTATAVLATSRSTMSATYSALHRSCFRGNAAYVRTLIQCGASIIINSAVVDPSISPDFCWTPLLCAVNNPNSDPAEVVELLLHHGADVHYRDDADCTALYYAIANGYPGAAAALLRHCPTLGSSTSTCPILVAVGAHLYHPCERDVRRLAQVLPSRPMLEVLCRSATNYTTLALAAHILQDKINGVDREPRFWERHVVAQELQHEHQQHLHQQQQEQHGGGDAQAAGTVITTALSAGAHQVRSATDKDMVELRTPEQQEALLREVRGHTALCERHRLELRAAVQVLYARCYWLSWQSWLAELDAQGNRHGRGAADDVDGGALYLTMHSLAATNRLQRSPVTRPHRGPPGSDEDEDGGGSSQDGSMRLGHHRTHGTPPSLLLKATFDTTNLGGSHRGLAGELDGSNTVTATALEAALMAATSPSGGEGRATQPGPTPSVPNVGLLWYQPRDLRRCLEYPASILPDYDSKPGHVEPEQVETSRGGTATAALVKALVARPGGILMSHKVRQREERLGQARRSVADIGSTLTYPED